MYIARHRHLNPAKISSFGFGLASLWVYLASVASTISRLTSVDPSPAHLQQFRMSQKPCQSFLVYPYKNGQAFYSNFD